MAYVQSKAQSAVNGQLQMNMQDVANALGKDVFAILSGREFSYGLDDPALISKLPKAPKDSAKPYRVYDGKKLITYGVPVSETHVLVKLSEVKEKTDLNTKGQGRKFSLTQVAEDKEWDLAILKVGAGANFKPFEWPTQQVLVEAGTGLVSLDGNGRLNWGVASDHKREIKKGRSVGPIRNKEWISKFRAPYKGIIRHSLPLLAQDAGTPIFSFDGVLIGLHMGRINRTSGLIIGIEDIKASVSKMMKSLEGEL